MFTHIDLYLSFQIWPFKESWYKNEDLKYSQGHVELLLIQERGCYGSKALFLSKIEIIWGQLLALPQTLCLSVGKPHHFTGQLFIISKTGLAEDMNALSSRQMMWINPKRNVLGTSAPKDLWFQWRFPSVSVVPDVGTRSSLSHSSDHAETHCKMSPATAKLQSRHNTESCNKERVKDRYTACLSGTKSMALMWYEL